MVKNFNLKSGGKKLLCSLVASGITMTSGAAVASAKQTDSESYVMASQSSLDNPIYCEKPTMVVITKDDGSKFETYNSNGNYSIKKPIELMIPTNIKLSKDGSMKFNYTTVVANYSLSTINPDEIIGMIDSANELNSKYNLNKFAYVDSNKTTHNSFKVNNSKRKSSKANLLKYISFAEKKNERERESIDSSKYGEFMLPVYARYSYTSNGKIKYYNKIEYITFYLPYGMISEKTNFAELAEIAYTRYQDGSFDHVITYSELQKVKVKTK